jgi:hypothetical protein|tara:strand:+ start:87 stop:194 length:108 start_codon:yes stop_codon:yes gene_type:complete
MREIQRPAFLIAATLIAFGLTGLALLVIVMPGLGG